MFFQSSDALPQFNLDTPVVYAYNLKEHYLNMERTISYTNIIQDMNNKTMISLRQLIEESINIASKNEQNYFKKINLIHKELTDMDGYLEKLDSFFVNPDSDELFTDLNSLLNSEIKQKEVILLKIFKDFRRMSGDKDDDGNYTEAKEFMGEQKSILEKIVSIAEGYLKTYKVSNNKNNKKEVDYIIKQMNYAVQYLNDKLDMNINTSNFGDMPGTLARYIGRAYELFGTAIIAANYSQVFTLFGFQGQKKGKNKNRKMIDLKPADIKKFGLNQKEISRHFDTLINIGNTINRVALAMDIKSSGSEKYTYNQSNTIQEILKLASNLDIASQNDLKEFAYVFVNMAYFEPGESKKIQELNEFIKNFMAISFAKEYVENTMKDPNIVPIVQINFKHYKVSDLLNGFLDYTQKIQIQKVEIAKISAKLEKQKEGEYMTGTHFSKMLEQKRKTVRLLKEKKSNKISTFDSNESFYYNVFSATKRYHIQITKKILAGKVQSYRYDFKPIKHIQ